RLGTITAGGQTFTVNQAGITCSYSLFPSAISCSSSSTNSSFNVTAPSGCSWTASTAYSWLHTTSSGNGSGTVSFSVDANSSTVSRSGTITADSQTFTVNQAAAPCIYSLSSTNAVYGPNPVTNPLIITASSGC